MPPVPGDCPQQTLYDTYLASYNLIPEALRPILGAGLLALMNQLDPNGDGNACNG